MTEAKTHLGAWPTVKMLGAIIVFALMIGSVIVAITRSIEGSPSREEFDRERDRTRQADEAIKIEQISIASSVRSVEAGLRRVEASQERVEDKLDKAIEARRER